MTEDNKDQLSGKDLLVAYFDLDYKLNPKGSNYWRNRLVPLLPSGVARRLLRRGFEMSLNWLAG